MKKIGLNALIKTQPKVDILEKIEKYLSNPLGFFHITSLNPENIVIACNDKEYRKAIITSQIRIVDGVGVVAAGRMLGMSPLPRYTGVDCMTDLLYIAHKRRLRVMLIGGRPKIAEKVVECQAPKFFEAKFLALHGISDIKNPTMEEERNIFSIVARYKPQILFTAFGSPAQELWLYNHRSRLCGIVCMGVGGAFDYLSGDIMRAPKIIRKIGLEWLFRLLVQPWRLRRQLNLPLFFYLVLEEKIGSMQICHQER